MWGAGTFIPKLGDLADFGAHREPMLSKRTVTPIPVERP